MAWSLENLPLVAFRFWDNRLTPRTAALITDPSFTLHYSGQRRRKKRFALWWTSWVRVSLHLWMDQTRHSVLFLTGSGASFSRNPFTSLAFLQPDAHGYASEGESFSIADAKGEVWIMEVIGRGPTFGRKGAVWVARRVPGEYMYRSHFGFVLVDVHSVHL